MKKNILISLIILFTLVSNAHSQQVRMAQPEPKQKTGEISILAYYSKTTYGDDVYATSRKFTGAFGLHMTPLTELEVAFTSTNTFFKQQSIQTVTVEEKILSASFVQTLVPPDFLIQPYLKLGGAQYNRKQNSTIAGLKSPEVYTKSPSVLAGGGLRIFVLGQFSIKMEMLMYFPELKFKQGKDNFSFEAGMGWAF